MDITEMEVFLVLCEELHFGRASERLHLPQPRVSRLTASLEQRVGGKLFERSSRRVRITPLGEQFRNDLRPAYDQMVAALAAARTAAESTAGRLRIGFIATAAGEALNRLVRAFEAANPDCELVVREVAIDVPLDDLRRGEIDVLVNWLTFDEPDLTLGPTIDVQKRMLAVAADHPLAGRDSVSMEELTDYPFPEVPRLYRASRFPFTPSQTPSGRPLTFHPQVVRTVHETISMVARGQMVHLTVASLSRMLNGTGVVLIPMRDLPPVELGLIWCTAHENARIRVLARIASGGYGGPVKRGSNQEDS